ncbi:MAG: CDP-archaeol synthase [Clostridia bacterium]|nr:CDP-archaeol synthase [Clostridia bacterium]
MLKRTITGFLLTAVAVPVVIFSHTYVLPIVLSLLSLIGTFEMLKCIGTVRNPLITVPVMIVAGAIPILARAIKNINYFTATYLALLMLTLFLMLAAGIFSKRTDVTDSAITFSLCMYVISGFVAIVLLRNEKGGEYYFLIPVIAPFTCDIFAYLTGRLFGKHKLIPSVSPKKTVEGAIGGTFFCTAICTGYGLILRHVLELEHIMPVWTFVVGGILIAVVSQIGDLIASVIKRKYGIKDYGKILPGHGGIVDRFDSVIPTAPLFLLLMIFFKNVVFGMTK